MAHEPIRTSSPPAFLCTSPPRCMHVDPTFTLTHTFHSDYHHQCTKHHLVVDSEVLLLKSVTCVLKCSLSLLCVPLIGTLSTQLTLLHSLFSLCPPASLHTSPACCMHAHTALTLMHCLSDDHHQGKRHRLMVE